MPKGIAPIIVAILLVLIVVVLSFMFLTWSMGVNEMYRNTTEKITESEIQRSQTSFFIVNAASNQVGIKNNGKLPINLTDFSFYLNETRRSVTPPPGTYIQPSETAIFTINGAIVPADYVVRVTGPYNLADEVFAPMG